MKGKTDTDMEDFVGWLTKDAGGPEGGWGESRGVFCPELRPPSYHRPYIITPQRSFTNTKWLAYQLCWCVHANQAGAPNNGPCVPLSVGGRSKGKTSRPPPINMDDMFQKEKKSSGGLGGGVRRDQRQTDGRGRVQLKLQTGMSSNLYLSRRFERIKADTVTLRTSVGQMCSHTRTKRIWRL